MADPNRLADLPHRSTRQLTGRRPPRAHRRHPGLSEVRARRATATPGDAEGLNLVLILATMLDAVVDWKPPLTCTCGFM
jgi:hypothetical protein